jgi:hypothetical protein
MSPNLARPFTNTESSFPATNRRELEHGSATQVMPGRLDQLVFLAWLLGY